MPKGKVKQYDVDRGCGSIIGSETGQVFIVYANGIVLEEDKAKLLEGQAVEFDIERNRKIAMAVNVAVLDESGDIHKKCQEAP